MLVFTIPNQATHPNFFQFRYKIHKTIFILCG